MKTEVHQNGTNGTVTMDTVAVVNFLQFFSIVNGHHPERSITFFSDLTYCISLNIQDQQIRENISSQIQFKCHAYNVVLLVHRMRIAQCSQCLVGTLSGKTDNLVLFPLAYYRFSISVACKCTQENIDTDSNVLKTLKNVLCPRSGVHLICGITVWRPDCFIRHFDPPQFT